MLSSILSIALVINELMASNAGSVMSPAYNFDSWIELYNPTSQAIDLSGMYLSDDADNLKRWQMPNNVGSVPAKGFRVVWLGSDEILTNQAPFKLDCDGGIIFLSDRSVPTSTSAGTARKSSDGKFTVSATTNYVFRLFRDGYLPSVPVKSRLPSLTSGASSRLSAKTDVALVAPGVALAVQPQWSPPSVLRAQAVRLRASGYDALVTI